MRDCDRYELLDQLLRSDSWTSLARFLDTFSVSASFYANPLDETALSSIERQGISNSFVADGHDLKGSVGRVIMARSIGGGLQEFDDSFLKDAIKSHSTYSYITIKELLDCRDDIRSLMLYSAIANGRIPNDDFCGLGEFHYSSEKKPAYTIVPRFSGPIVKKLIENFDGSVKGFQYFRKSKIGNHGFILQPAIEEGSSLDSRSAEMLSSGYLSSAVFNTYGKDNLMIDYSLPDKFHKKMGYTRNGFFKSLVAYVEKLSIDGDIGLCDYCGEPIDISRSGSVERMFCTDSHKTLKANERRSEIDGLFAKGISIEEAISIVGERHSETVKRRYRSLSSDEAL